MKKFVMLLAACFFLITLSGCGWSDSPISTTRPLPSYQPAPVTTENPDSSNRSEDDERDEPEIVRQEIATMIRDAEDLIAEGLFDDAKMVLRDLRSRALTDAEKKQVNNLLSKLNTISD